MEEEDHSTPTPLTPTLSLEGEGALFWLPLVDLVALRVPKINYIRRVRGERTTHAVCAGLSP